MAFLTRYGKQIERPRNVQISLNIIIVNWNSGEQLRVCINSISNAIKESFSLRRVIVVDNGSTDNSLADIERPGVELTVLRNNYNRGFAAACNQGAKNADGEYILFLNPDMSLERDSLEAPIKYMISPKADKVGVCGIQLIDRYGNIERSCSRLPNVASYWSKITGLDKLAPKTFPSYVMTEWDHESDQYVEHVTGAFLLLPKGVFEFIGGFDEDYFVYMEDLDLSVRLKEAGLKSRYLTSVRAFHQSGGCSAQIKGKRLSFSLHSRIIYACKHLSRGSAAVVLLGILIIEPISRFVHAIIRKSWAEIPITFEAYFLLWTTIMRRLRRSLFILN